MGHGWWALLACLLASIWGPLPPSGFGYFRGPWTGACFWARGPWPAGCFLCLLALLGGCGRLDWARRISGNRHCDSRRALFGLPLVGLRREVWPGSFFFWFWGLVFWACFWVLGFWVYDHRLDVHLHLGSFCFVLVPFLGLGDRDARAKPWGSFSFW